MSKHTPGPWRVEKGTFEINIVSKDGRNIANVSHPESWGENPFDADLIAAAPELLEALKSARDTIEWILGCTEPSRDEIEKAIKEADTIIAKAEGRV